MESVKFYKEGGDVWLNKEYLVQLNLTGDCALNCEFCYMSKHKRDFLSIEMIKRLWTNLRKYSEEIGIEYRVNITGGDIFRHPSWKEIARFIAQEETITAVDPLINRFWNEDQKSLLQILRDKINFVQLNPDVVEESDIIAVRDIGKKVVLKIALYQGDCKQNIDKLKYLSEKYENIIISIDLIIPQKGAAGHRKDYLAFDFPALKTEVKRLKGIFGDRLWLLSSTVKREYLKEIYYCPVPFGGVYIMPDGKVVPCSRYSHLNTGFDVLNFDLIEYVKKYDKLCSNYCLFENKKFNEFWSKEDNPADPGFWREK